MAFLIDIEGIDGSGKGTQSRLLYQRLVDSKFQSELISFPRYEQSFFGHRIADFLNGKYGSLHEVDPFLVSLLFASDRFESRDVLLKAWSTKDVVLLDRYVPSNMAHQGAKLIGAERAQLIEWIDRMEYQIFGLPRPDLVIYLDLPVERAQERIQLKGERGYTTNRADIQESDLSHLHSAHEVYEKMAENNPAWRRIPSFSDGEPLRTEQVAELIWNAVSGSLPKMKR